MKIFGLGTQSRFLINVMQDAPAKILILYSVLSHIVIHATFLPLHRLKTAIAKSFLTAHYYFMLFSIFLPQVLSFSSDFTQKASFSLSPKSSNLVWATMCMKDVVDNTGGLLPSNSPV